MKLYITRFKLAEDLKTVKFQLSNVNNLNSSDEKNDNDDNFTYINDNKDIPTDNDSDNESQISTNTRGDIESNEDYFINIFRNRVQLDTNTARDNNKREIIDEFRNNNNIYIISLPVFKKFKSLTVLI